jgi:hypothetical protein
VYLLLLIVALLPNGLHAQNEEPAYSYKDFYDNLAPYGQWIEDASLGYVWSPDVEGGFRPYFTKGHWSMTQYGNTWISDYVWGWACFHYGRWTFDKYYGWLWVPGSDWGAAWVMWRLGTGYYGWAPLAPDYKFKANLVADKYEPPNDWWVFLPPRYLYTGNYYNYWSGPTGNSSLIKHTQQENHYFENSGVTYVTGPYAREVEKQTGKPVTQYHLGTSVNLMTKTHQDDIKMFRPAYVKPLYVLGNNPTPPAVIEAPRPVTDTPQAINDQYGTASAPFRTELTRNPALLAKPENKNVTPVGHQAPQRPDPISYDWKNPEKADQPDSVEYKVAPIMHPDHGPAQQPDPMPRAKDPHPKKLPSPTVQDPEPVKNSNQSSQK